MKMESKNQLKEIDIKNRTCYCFDDIMKTLDIFSGGTSLDEKSYKIYENTLIYEIPYKNVMGLIPLCIRFNKIDGFIKIYYGIRYLVILGHSWFGEICDSIKYLINEKSGITNTINHNFGQSRIDSPNS